MLEHVREVTQFFNSHPKHCDLLCSKITLLLPSARHSRLVDFCRTRWVARLDALDVFIEAFRAIVAALEHIKKNVDSTWAPDVIKAAYNHFNGVFAFDFIATLVIICRLLGITRPLTKQLQSSTLDALSAIDKITLLFATIKRSRKDIDEMHSEWYAEGVEIPNQLGIVPCKPRTVDIQIYRCNVPSASISEYYKRAITIPFLDHLQSQVEVRFSQKNIDLLYANFAFPHRVVNDSDWDKKFYSFLSTCNDDLPEPKHLTLELKMWEEYWLMYKDTLPVNLSSLLRVTDRTTFPNIYEALKIAATIPVTTCTCERSISALRRLKTYLRNTMSEDRMNSLALMHAHRDIIIDAEKVIDRFAIRHPRRMKLLDILNEDPSDSSEQELI